MPFNILVVDDSLPMRKMIKKTVIASGFGAADYDEASDGSEAMKIMKEKWIHLLMTGYNMPNMNGLELISGMKVDEALKTIPVVVITAEGCPERIREFEEKGAAAFIIKPFKPEKIREKIYEIFKIGYSGN